MQKENCDARDMTREMDEWRIDVDRIKKEMYNNDGNGWKYFITKINKLTEACPEKNPFNFYLHAYIIDYTLEYMSVVDKIVCRIFHHGLSLQQLKNKWELCQHVAINKNCIKCSSHQSHFAINAAIRAVKMYTFSAW